jgi:hypothetical protein
MEKYLKHDDEVRDSSKAKRFLTGRITVSCMTKFLPGI